MSSASVDDDLFDTVAADFLARFRNGERPKVDDYTARHPEIAAEIRELFPTMLAIEKIKLQKEHSSGGQASLGARKLERLGDFRIIREIGRGGMGVVFEAEQESLERHVALKVLPPNALQDESHVRRFHREAQTAARLHHTNIVPVFGVGADDGLHYYVMQLIDGAPLDRGVRGERRAPLEPRRAAEIVRQICDAVQFAHEQGTLHRDIKPANILLDQQGHVWITDFGLAQVLEREDTVTDGVAGTLRYMAPERFRGVADEQSDQYSLGITLYELVSGTRAFEGSSTGELMHRITHGEPSPLRSVAPAVPRDLQTIIAKSISREPKHRYRSVGELAADLQRFLDGRPIIARRVSWPERAWRWCRRNRALAASLASVASLLMLVAAMLVVGYFRSRQNGIRLQGLVDAKETALRNESTALQNERQARELERTARERSESITGLALEGLDRVFDEFAPASPYTVALPVDANGEDEPLLLPAQATVTPQVAAVLEQLLPLYQQLADETAHDFRIRLRSASAQYRLGLIYRQLGRQEAARMAFAASRSLLDDLIQDPLVPVGDVRLLLAQVLNDLGDLDRQLNPVSRERRETHTAALSLLSDAPATSLIREEQLELARTHYFLGRRDFFFPPPPRPPGEAGSGPGERGRRDRGDAGRPEAPPSPPDVGVNGPPPEPVDARPEQRPLRWDGGEQRGPGSERRPNSEGGGGRRGDGDRGRGNRSRGGFGLPNREELQQHLKAAISLLENLPYAARDTRAQLLLAKCYREQANQRPFEDRDGRQSDWEQATAVLRQLVHEAPNTPEFRFELGETIADVEPRFLPEDRFPEAETRLREALALSQQLVAEAPDVPAYSAAQTQTLVRLAYVLRRIGRPDEARQRYSEAIVLQSGLSKRFPESPTHRVWTARVKRYLAEILINEHQFEDAATLLRESAAEVEPLLQSADRQGDPEIFFATFTLGETYRLLADILVDQGQAAEAEVFQQRARDLSPQNFMRSRRPPPDTAGPGGD